MFKILLLLISITISNITTSTQLIYVSPTGNDNNPGTLEKPLASFKAARDRARELLKNHDSIEVIFRDGYYYFDETVVLDHRDFSEKGTVSYKALAVQ